MNNQTTELKEDDIVLCSVRRIVGTTIFLDIEGDGEGSMTVSEVSPGRIRNLREFVAPNKRVVCKVLRITPQNIELSLRRVTTKEREEVLEKYKKARMLENILKPTLKDKTPAILQKIKENYDLADFLDEARENPEIINKFVTPKQASELAKKFKEKKDKEKEVKEIIKLKSISPSGALDIKETLYAPEKNADIRYLGSSKFSIKVKANTYKEANSLMDKVLNEIKSKTKKLNVLFEVKGK